MRGLAVVLVLAGCEATAADVAGDGEPRWEAVPGLEICAVERLVGDTTGFAEPWRSCGEDCRTRAAVPRSLPHHVADRTASAAQVVEGELVLRTSVAGPQWRYEIIERASGAAPELVVRMTNECHVTAHKTGAALLVEMFRDPAEHFVAVASLASKSLTVHPTSVTVRPPVAGWFVDDGHWGMIDGVGVHASVDGELETTTRSSDWLLAPRARDGAVAWIDWGRTPAAVVRSSGAVLETEHDVVAFSDPAGPLAWLEVDGPDTLTGSYDAATLRWPEGRADLTGRVASTIRMGLDEEHVGLSTPGNGGEIAAAFVRVERTSGTVEVTEPPRGKFWDLAANTTGHWLLQEFGSATPSRLDAWIVR